MPRLAGKQSNTVLYVIIAILVIIAVLVLLQVLGVVHFIPGMS